MMIRMYCMWYICGTYTYTVDVYRKKLTVPTFGAPGVPTTYLFRCCFYHHHIYGIYVQQVRETESIILIILVVERLRWREERDLPELSS